MSQLNWIYLDDFGGKHKVGLFHGDKDGHLMVYVNTRIIIIDFNIKDSKKYNFYIGEELCEIEVEKNTGDTGFKYGFRVNNQVDTPLNRARKASNSTHLVKTLFLFLFIIILVFLVYYLIK